MEKSDNSEPSGFGGWLIFVLVAQTLAPLITVVQFWTTALQYGPVLDRPGGTIVVTGEVFLNIALLAIEITSLVLMYRMSRRFPNWFTAQCVARSLSPVLDWLLVWWIFDIPIDRLVEDGDARTAYNIIIGSVVWVIYIHRSVRVRNTFVG